MTTRKPFLLRLDPELHERVRIIAFEEKLSMQEVIVRILDGVIANYPGIQAVKR